MNNERSPFSLSLARPSGRVTLTAPVPSSSRATTNCVADYGTSSNGGRSLLCRELPAAVLIGETLSSGSGPVHGGGRGSERASETERTVPIKSRCLPRKRFMFRNDNYRPRLAVRSRVRFFHGSRPTSDHDWKQRTRPTYLIISCITPSVPSTTIRTFRVPFTRVI